MICRSFALYFKTALNETFKSMELVCHQNKARDIISKLKRLECPTLESSDDTWAMEILLKPNFERYQIMEWILSKLEFRVPDVSTNQNSSERIAENLLAAVSALGICHEEDSHIIQGTSSFKDQLRLWNFLVNILWKKCSLTQKNENASFDRISEEYNKSCDYIHKLCNNVSMGALFDKKVQLFPPYVLEESKEALRKEWNSKRKSLEDIKDLSNAALKNNSTNISVNISDISKELGNIELNDSVLLENEKLLDVEANINSALLDLEKHACTEFNEAYLNLKPYLSNVTQDETIDVGPQFKEAQVELETLSNLNKSLFLLKKSELDLETLNSGLKDHHLQTEPLSGSSLREYNTILNNCKFSAEEK